MDTLILSIFGVATLAGGAYFYFDKPKETLEQPEVFNSFTFEEIVLQVFNTYKSKMDNSITYDMLLKMASIESSRGLKLERIEQHIKSQYSLYSGFDASLGAFQVLTSTANWLYSDMGYTAEGNPTVNSLKYDLVQNTYFAMAYLDYLARRARRENRFVNDSFLLMSYNGGYGNVNNQTRNHYNKYIQTKGA
jgi:hypothetical protein